MLDTKTKNKMIAIIEDYVKIPEEMRDHVCETLYKAYVEAKTEAEAIAAAKAMQKRVNNQGGQS